MWEQLFFNRTTEAMDCATGIEFLASSIIFELHEEEGEYVVKARYNGKYMHLCGSQRGECPFE